MRFSGVSVLFLVLFISGYAMAGDAPAGDSRGDSKVRVAVLKFIDSRQDKQAVGEGKDAEPGAVFRKEFATELQKDKRLSVAVEEEPQSAKDADMVISGKVINFECHKSASLRTGIVTGTSKVEVSVADRTGKPIWPSPMVFERRVRAEQSGTQIGSATDPRAEADVMRKSAEETVKAVLSSKEWKDALSFVQKTKAQAGTSPVPAGK